jgi:hypothetical protein
MTTVNMDEPLPAIRDLETSTMYTMLRAMIHDGSHVPMNLSHLVQVLGALTGQQLGAIVCVLSDERKQALAAALDWPDEREEYERSRKRLYAQAMEEKARADRAEQHLAIVAEGLVARGMARGLVEQLIADAAALLPVESKNG